MSVPELEIVAARTATVAGHTHIVAVKLADGTIHDAAEVIKAVEAHDAHYVMHKPGMPLPMLVQTRRCPDCNETELFA